MKVGDILHRTTQFFREKGIESARLDTELLIAHAMKWSRVHVYMNLEYPLSEAELTACRDLVRRRSKGEPIAYIVGKKYFYHNEFEVRHGVLIPRPETELLVEAALKKIKTADEGVIFDLGVGSGCIGLSILKERKNLKLLGFDIADAALETTTANVEKLGLQDRVSLIQGAVEDVTPDQVQAWLKERDWHSLPLLMVVANPPYISYDDPEIQASVKEFEPSEALFSEDQGLYHIKSWLSWANSQLPNGAWVMFEMGSQQKAPVLKWLEEQKMFKNCEVITDLSGLDRHLIAQK